MKTELQTDFLWRVNDEIIYRDREDRTGGHFEVDDDVSDLSDVELFRIRLMMVKNRNKNNKSLDT
jgi:hypothetical protein